jgi:heat shock protein HslJ
VAPAGGETKLANTKWRLVSFVEDGAETEALEGGDVTLEFRAEGRAGGSSGCNSYGSDYKAHGSELTFGPIMSTKRACVDEGRMRQEQRFFQAMQSARSFEIADGELRISYDEGRGVLSFVKFEN